MALSSRLVLKQTHSLAMTQHLQQAIRLLQMNNLDLSSFIEDALEQNPLLERDMRGKEAGVAPSQDFLDQLPAPSKNLREHVCEQINTAFQDPIERALGCLMADFLNESGWFEGDLLDISRKTGLGVDRLEQLLRHLQRLDPVGIFARNLAECLALQLRDKNRLDPAMQAMLDHLDLVAKRDYATLKKICGVDHEDILDMIGEIRALDPRPGFAFQAESPAIIIPDILLSANGRGGWYIELNPHTLPRLLVNQSYSTEILAKLDDKHDKALLREQRQAAHWLVKALDQRAVTILKVAREIVARQSDFLAQGIEALKPLTLRDIASATGLHESTISRVTKDKTMATPRGTIELRRFFTQALTREDGSSDSAASVRHRIKVLIDSESAHNILSDDKIVELLKKDGVEIARRTVAKYREALGIASSAQRKREKRL